MSFFSCATGLRDDDDGAQAERIGDDGEADAGVARGPLDDQPALAELAAVDRVGTLGLGRLYFAEFRDSISDTPGESSEQSGPRDLEADLNSSLDALFGPIN